MTTKIKIYIENENGKTEFETIGCEAENADAQIALHAQAMADAGADLSQFFAICEPLRTNWDFEQISEGRIIIGRETAFLPRFEYLAHMVGRK